MTRLRNIAGVRFGLLTAIEVSGRDSTGKTTWRCACDCGRETVATMLNITNGTTKSCGCLRTFSKKREDFVGLRFGMLVAVSIADGLHWLCQCDCGRESVVATVHLKRTHTRSCGCLRTSPTPTRSQLLRRGRNALVGWSKAVKDDAHGSCDCCHSTDGLHAHHIMPFATHRGLSNHPENGSALCGKCHRAVHRRIANGVSPGLALAQEIAHCAGAEVDECIQYVSRWKDKGGVDDLRKAQHYLQKLIELQVAA